MRKSFIYIALFVTAISCDKYKSSRDDISQDLYLRGRAFVFDETGTLQVKPIGGKGINIGYSDDNTNNYIFSATSDANGYFLFEHLKKDTKYAIYSEYEDNGIRYNGRFDTSFSKSLDSSYLNYKVSEKKQNGVIYTVKDLTSGLVNNCSICMFANNFGNTSCNNPTYSLTSNPFGIASKFNMPAGVNYTVYFKATFGTTTLIATDVINNMVSEGIVRKTIIVQ